MQTFGLKYHIGTRSVSLLAKLTRENIMGKYCNFIVLVKMRKSQPSPKPQVGCPKSAHRETKIYVFSVEDDPVNLFEVYFSLPEYNYRFVSTNRCAEHELYVHWLSKWS